ncbi:integrase [Loigolactobacillus backii]|uniref:site-specific integrase n=1 Tax=Loigolactobacillus backii TaxID=375175 RepID=UPI0007F185B2|nr:site-specific integrase [Loigolactobacillus backii]ANK66883.1 integrase [Loigolactobacillus backii]
MASIAIRDGLYQAKVYFYDKDGKRHAKSHTGFKTQKEAQKWANSMQKRVFDDQVSIDSSTPLPYYFWDWFETYKESSVTDRTKSTYKQVYNVLLKYFDNKPIELITRRDYQLFLKKYGKRHAKSTVSKNNSLIHACIKDAIYDSVINKDFVGNTSIVFDPKRTQQIDYLNMNELAKLTNHLENSLNYHFTAKYMILLAVYTGMRLGEIQGLKWNDINTKFKTVSVKRAWNETTHEFKTTKNKSSVRIIRVNQNIIDILTSLYKNKHAAISDQVFINQYNTVPTSSAVNKTLKNCLREINVNRQGFHFHSLRHTHVAYLLAKQVDLYAISKRLGHSDIGTTTRVYSYLIDEYKVKTDNEIEGVLDDINQFKTNSNDNDNESII